MAILRKIGLVILGILLIVVVVWLGFAAASNPVFVPWFGIASAILAPVGLGIVGFALKSSDAKALRQLTKITEINQLISKAQTAEEKVRLLEEERSKLLQTIKFETRRGALIARKESLENEASRILSELRVTTDELSQLKAQLKESPVSAEVHELERILQAKQRGEIVFKFGDKAYTVNPEIFNAFVPYGNLFVQALTWVSRMTK